MADNVDKPIYKVIPHNARVYMDIATDMYRKEKGIFTFIVRVDGKKIVDYVQLESINYGETEKGR